MLAGSSTEETKAHRAPVRKYIRKAGDPCQQRVAAAETAAEDKPAELELSVESLKKKFGLTGSKFSGLLRDDDRMGRTGKGASAPYPWK